MPIRAKLFLAQLGLSLCGVLVLGLVVYWVTSLSLKASQRNLMDYVAQYVGESFDDLITHKQSALERIALGEPIDLYVKTFNKEQLIDYFSQFNDTFPVLSFVNTSSQEEFQLNQGYTRETSATVADTPLFQMALSKPNQTVFTLSKTGTDPNTAFVAFAFCRQNAFDEILGTVVGKVPICEFVNKANEFKFHKVGYAAILDSSGHLIAHPDIALIGDKLTTNIPDLTTPHFKGISQNSIDTRGMIMGTDSYIVYRFIPRRHWIVLTVLPYDQYISTLHAIRDWIMLSVLVGIAITFVMSAVLAKHMTRPILKLVMATRDIAEGNFTQHVTVTSKDELGELACSFNDMAKRLEATMTSIDKLNHEIRQRELAENRQADLLQQIEATNAELKNFAYIVSHDLKAPLRGIKTIADWIQTDYAGKLDEDGKEQLALLVQRVDRMKNLIEGVLQYSRLGREHEDIQPAHLDNILPDIIDSLAVPEHITVSIDKPLPKVHYEPTRLSQVFQNLLSNAVKYMDKPKGEVHIDFTEDDDHWTFSISDNGPGIDAKYHEKIFGIFQTLNPKDEYESTGVGLAVVKKTVELAGGRIWITSEVGKGSTFSFTVPKPDASTVIDPETEPSLQAAVAKSA